MLFWSRVDALPFLTRGWMISYGEKIYDQLCRPQCKTMILLASIWTKSHLFWEMAYINRRLSSHLQQSDSPRASPSRSHLQTVQDLAKKFPQFFPMIPTQNEQVPQVNPIWWLASISLHLQYANNLQWGDIWNLFLVNIWKLPLTTLDSMSNIDNSSCIF